MNEQRYAEAMRRAIALAQRSPAFDENPRVGAVILNEAGNVMAEGWHQGVGTPHAEVDALNKLQAAGIAATGYTAVVTLEPCNHTGHTGPCAQALIDAGIKRVVFASSDPGKVEGGGAERLRAAGVEVIEGLMADEYYPTLLPWLVNKFSERPYVVVKYAASIDGRTAASDGTSKWITGAEARIDVHARRAEAQAIIAGTNTIEVDDPELTARKTDGSLYENQPLRVIVGERELSPTLRVFNGDAQTLHLTTRDLHQVMAELWSRGIRQAFVEGGAELESALIQAKLADEFLIYQAPKLIGGSHTAIREIGVATIADAIELQFVESVNLGNDILIRAVRKA
ncbi:MAG: bifunctional diaminohydroxyphosphoribosylaminopyrimidine deaminase/5-amino-6-(5-phosphoribosylamino)uracil reductase RibD [Micrococcales bacterium]